MKDEEFVLFQDFLEKKSGLHFDQSKIESLKVSLLQRIKINQLENFEQYYRFLAFHPAGEKELRNLLPLITINESSFFRQKEQFIVLEEEILPSLIREKEKKGKFSLNIWSAGCACGEEPYTIALILEENFPQVKNWEVQILGTDIDEKSLEEAKKGIYRTNSLRSTDRIYLKKYFNEVGNQYYLNEEIKKKVSFAYHNLAGESYPFSVQGKWDIIFCRNVLIYFKPEKIEKIFDHFYRHLSDSGYLFLGYAESIGRFSKFSVIHTGNTFYYKKEVITPTVTPVRILKKSIEKVPPEVITSPEDKFEKLYQEILKLFDREEFKLALEKVEQMVGRRGDHFNSVLPQAYYLRGLVYNKLNRIEDAIKEFKRTIYLDKNFLMAHFYLAEIYSSQGKKKDALREYKNILHFLEKGDIEEPIPFSGWFSKKALAEICQRNIERFTSWEGVTATRGTRGAQSGENR